jgi:hypothetical protein
MMSDNARLALVIIVAGVIAIFGGAKLLGAGATAVTGMIQCGNPRGCPR